jgi:C-terminal processing protease CtpA/Prc
LRRILLPLVILAASALFAQQPTAEQDRLLATCKLWTTVKYFHPYLAYRNIDWDQALVDALPKIRSASNSADYAAALRSMLDALHDPATYVPTGASPRQETGGIPQRTFVHNGLNSPAFQVQAAGEQPKSITIPMGQDVEAVVRLSEAVTSPPYPTPQPDRAYAAQRYPSPELRILAGYKIWAVIHYFFAYRDLMDEDWDDLFASFLPKFIAAKTAREYNLTIAELIAYLTDSQAGVDSPELTDYFGAAPVGLKLRLIDKKAVIVGILDKEAESAEVRVGDIVSELDGLAIADRINKQARYVSASTTPSLARRVMQRVLNGADGSPAALTILDSSGASKPLKLKRSASFLPALAIERTGDVIKTLPGGIGYVDLNRLRLDQVDSTFEKLAGAKAIIFDARGSTRISASAIAAHLNTKPDVAAAIFTGPLALTPDLSVGGQLTSTASFFFVQALPPPATHPYAGQTVMLVDERTIAAAEHIGLFLEAANHTVFIGTNSAGSTGETTSFVVPGGVTITFSSEDVRHGNAGKLQRVGLEPAESVPETISGIRSGRDEVLDHALEYLSR